jgi:hypothetical protein
MKSLVLGLSILCASPGMAVERQPARLSGNQWVVAAVMEDGVSKVCFQAGTGEPKCVTQATPVANAQFSLDGTDVRVLGPLPLDHLAAIKLSLDSSAEVRAYSCRTADAVELCSAPSTDLYALQVVATPQPPKLIDLEEIRAQVQKIQGALDGIRSAIGDSR